MAKRLGFLFLFFLFGYNSFSQNKENTLHALNSLLINTVMDDVYNPVISCRIYTYPHIAFYECIRYDDPSLPSLQKKLNGFNNLPPYPAGKQIDNFIAACVSFSYVGQNLVGSEYKIEEWRTAFIDSIRQYNADNTVANNSIAWGKQVADSIISWSKKDNYLKSRGMTRHVIGKKDGTWQPTPNDYAQALEPYWNMIRPMAMTSCGQFEQTKKLLYDPSRKSEFFKNVREVYDIGKANDSMKNRIARYWDDNPNISVVEGHLTYFVHKISPAGHWLKITGQACREKNIPVAKASQAYTLASIAMFDAFISCWDGKFKVDLVRPVTVINKYIDAKWEPLIQTPPFPEFPSGHAMISNAAATVLTKLLGENYSFTDNTEIPFGIKPRSFRSFYAAAEESSWSRVFGGIHYPETARISIKQGRAIGAYVLGIYEK